MAQQTPDENEDRKAAAVTAADPGSNHGVGVDGDEDSTADAAHHTDPHPAPPKE